MSDLDDRTKLDIWDMTGRLQEIITRRMRAQGFNIGLNIGQVAGAGLPGHLHVHLVPRWRGDTNFMPVLADIKVIPQHLDQTRRLLGEELAKKS